MNYNRQKPVMGVVRNFIDPGLKVDPDAYKRYISKTVGSKNRMRPIDRFKKIDLEKLNNFKPADTEISPEAKQKLMEFEATLKK